MGIAGRLPNESRRNENQLPTELRRLFIIVSLADDDEQKKLGHNNGGIFEVPMNIELVTWARRIVNVQAL